MKIRIVATALALLWIPPSLVLAQGNPIQGVWELTAQINAQGVAIKNINSHVAVFTEEGVYVSLGLPKGRPKVDKINAQMTEAELHARFDAVGPAQYGTYTVSGDRVTRQVTAALNPANDGQQVIEQFKVEGDVLIITSTNPNSKAENRFRKLKKAGTGSR